MNGAFLADVRALARTATRRGMVRAMACLDRRLAGVELIGWPALAQSLRSELEEAVAIAKARGIDVSVPAYKPPDPNPLGHRRMTCAICAITTDRAGSRRILHNGAHRQVCAPCAQKAGR